MVTIQRLLLSSLRSEIQFQVSRHQSSQIKDLHKIAYLGETPLLSSLTVNDSLDIAQSPCEIVTTSSKDSDTRMSKPIQLKKRIAVSPISKVLITTSIDL